MKGIDSFYSNKETKYHKHSQAPIIGDRILPNLSLEKNIYVLDNRLLTPNKQYKPPHPNFPLLILTCGPHNYIPLPSLISLHMYAQSEA